MITSVTVRVRRLPAVNGVRGLAVRRRSPPAADAMRTLAQDGLLPTVLRLSDETETAINLADPDAIGAGGDGGCLMIVGHEGEPAAVAARRAAVAAVLTGLGGTDARGGARPGVGARPLPRAVPPRLAARRRRARRDAGDGDVLVAPASAVRRGQGRARRLARRRAPLVLCHVSHVYETGARSTSPSPPGRARTRSRSGPPPRPRRATRSSRPAPRSPTTTRSAPTTSRGSPQEIGPVGVEILRAVKDALDPTGVLNPGVLIP